MFGECQKFLKHNNPFYEQYHLRKHIEHRLQSLGILQHTPRRRCRLRRLFRAIDVFAVFENGGRIQQATVQPHHADTPSLQLGNIDQ